MAGLYKKEVLIREVSTVSVPAAMTWTINWITNTFQNKASNIDGNGDYIDFYFADIFDSRDGNIYRVYTEACKPQYSMTNIEYTILDNSLLAQKAELPKPFNDEKIINGNSVTLTYAPLDGVILSDEVNIIIEDPSTETVSLLVDYTLNGKILTVIGDVPNEFSGKKVKVSYLYVV